ncbi:MAG: hypothetical protein ACW976_01690 [Candidatus Ranarchaeia archaeon]|jgi:hypothetical protein
MVSDFELFIAIAEIAGIFIGFGALISVTRRDEIAPVQLARLRGVVTIGLTVIVVALIPIGISRFGFTDHTLWFFSSFIYLAINWVGIISGFRKEENRQFLVTEVQTKLMQSVFFWFLLEIPLQVPLVLTLLGWYPTLEAAFYTTSLLFYLFEAVFVLAQVVWTSEDPPETSSTGKPQRRIIPH